MPLLNVAIGTSDKRNLLEAAEEAANKTKQKVTSPKLLIVYFTFNYPPEEYLMALNKIQSIFSADIPLVGGSVFGFVTKDESYDAMAAAYGGDRLCGAGILALESDYLYVGTGIGTGVDKDAREAGKVSIFAALNSLRYNPSVAYLAMLKKGVKDIINIRPISGFLFSPSPGPNHPQIGGDTLEGISSVVKRAVRIIGGGARGGLPIGWPKRNWSKE